MPKEKVKKEKNNKDGGEQLKKAAEPKIGAGGVGETALGIVYQSKLIQWFAYKGYESNIEFEIFTELEAAGKFDDLIFKYTDKKDGSTKYRLLQAKQKAKLLKMDLEFLLKDKKYSFYKYFDSLLGMKEGYVYEEIDDLIFITNNDFEFHVKDIDNIVTLSMPNIGQKNIENLRLEVQILDDQIFENYGCRVKFPKDRYLTENLNFLKSWFLAEEMFGLVFKEIKSEKKLNVLKNIESTIKDQILERDDSTQHLKIKDSVWKIEDGGIVSTFANILSFLVQSKLNHKTSIGKRYDIQNTLSNGKHKFVIDDEKFKKHIYSAQSIDIDDYIGKFMKKYVLVANFTEQKMDDFLQIKFKDKFKTEAKFISKGFKEQISDWITTQQSGNKIEGNKLNNAKVEKFLYKCQGDLWCEKFELKKFELFQNKETPIFKPQKSRLMEFIDKDNDDKVPEKDEKERGMVLRVPNNEMIFYSTMIYQKKQSMIFLQTSFSEELFEKGLMAFSESGNELCVIVCDKNHQECESFLPIFKASMVSVWENLKKNPKNKFILICSTDCQLSKIFPQESIFEEGTVKCELLKNVQYYVDQNVNFQGKEIQLGKLIGADEVSEVPLSELLYTKKIGPVIDVLKNFDKENYVSRRIIRKVYLKLEIQKHFIDSDVKLCYDESNFQGEEKAHLLEFRQCEDEDDDDGKKIRWKKSKINFSLLRHYVDEKSYDEMEVKDFLDTSAQFTLFSDSAGNGKSCFLHNLTLKFREHLIDHWILGIDMKSYESVLEEIYPERETLSDPTKIVDIFESKILKLETILEKVIFRKMVKEKKIRIVLDAFDEISMNCKEVILILLESLIKRLDIKVFLSTRPEYNEEMENRFLEFKHSLLPFSEEDQRKYLDLKFSKSKHVENNRSKIAEAVIDVVKQTFQEKDFYGSPLVSKLVADFFLDQIEGIKNNDKAVNHYINKTLVENQISLFKLIEHFINNTIANYCKIKLQFNTNKKEIATFLEPSILRFRSLHQTIGLQVIVGENCTKQLVPKPEINEQHTKMLLKCGLVYKEGAFFRFPHNCYAEFLVAKFLAKNFNKCPNVQNFTIKIIFKEKGFSVVRSFLNSCITDMIYEENFHLLKPVIQDSVTVLHVAAEEKNLDTFRLLLSCVVHDLKSDADKEEAKKKLLTLDEFGTSIFFYYYRRCNDDLNLMKFFEEKFDLNFVRKVLSMKNVNEFFSGNIAIISSWHGNNYLKFYKWMLNEFKDDPGFLNEMVLSVDHHKNGILHNALYKFYKDEFFELLQILNKANIDTSVKKSLLLLKNKEGQNFLSYISYADDLFEDDGFVTTLKWLKSQCGQNQELLYEIVSNQDNDGYTIIHYFLQHSKKLYVPKFVDEFGQWLKINLPELDLKQFLLKKNKWEQNFLNLIVLKDSRNEATASLIEVLNRLKQLFFDDEDTLKELILNKYSNDEYLIGYYTEKIKKRNLGNFMRELCKWLKNNIPGIDLKSILKHKNIYGRTFFYLIMFEDFKGEAASAVLEILDWLKEEFDEELVVDLLQSKDPDNYLFFHYYAECPEKSHFLKVLSNVCNWIKNNLKNFDLKQFLLNKTLHGHNFLLHMLPNDKNNEVHTVIVKTLKWLKTEFNNDQEFLQELVLCRGASNENILHFAAFRLDKKNIARFVETFLTWMQKNILNFNLKEFLLQLATRNENFLCCALMNDPKLEGNQALIEILDWLKTENFDIIGDLLLMKNQQNQNFLHFLVNNCIKEFALTVYKDLSDWLRCNYPNNPLQEMLEQTDYLGKRFADYLNLNDDDPINNDWKAVLETILCFA